MKKENQRIMLTKRLLKESLVELTEGRKVQDITVSELCEHAGINRSTFYAHYCCPYDVLSEIEDDIISHLNEIWERETVRTSWDIVKRTEALCTYLQENRKIALMLIRNNDSASGFPVRLFKAGHMQLVYDEIDTSEIKTDSQKRLMLTFLFSGSYNMLRTWLVEDLPITPHEMGELVGSMAAGPWIKTGPDRSGPEKDRSIPGTNRQYQCKN
ncbi:MAG: TetR/AcrR family transcriptional regulator C-terminal domain-containing protein [Bullifex sp.]